MQPRVIPADLPVSVLLGVRVHHATLPQAVDAVRGLLQAGGTHHIVTVNGAMLVRAAQEERVRRILNEAALAVADGAGVLLTARLLGRPAFTRVPGVELVGALCAMAAADGYRVFLLGAAPGVAEAAAEALRRQHPGLVVAGVMHGYVSDDAAIVDQIRRASPHLLFVAMGFPKQEVWIAAHRDRLGVPVSMGVGGTFDVLSGRVARAPRWVQHLALEWVYRMVQEPRRWRNVAGLPQLIWLALRDRVKERVSAEGRRGY